MSSPPSPHVDRGMIGESLSSRHNSLNFLRLVLALLVLYDHSAGLGGFFGNTWTLNQTSIGTIAVFGFFGISGYLIAASAERNRPARYLWQRFLRIFPGFWICLIVTAFLFGTINWLVDPIPQCGISCYFHAKDGPLEYLYRNWLLPNPYLAQFGIAGTPKGVPFGVAWNGSVWTLFYEFICYLLLMAFALAGFLRHRLMTLAFTIGLWALIVTITLNHSLDHDFTTQRHSFFMNLFKFAVVFLVGAVIFLYRKQIPDSGWLALVCAIVFVASLWLPNGAKGHGIGARNPLYFFTASGLLTPFVVYPVLWLGIHLPFQRLGSRNDYSYGIYIYAYPVSQLMAVAGTQKWGYPAYLSLCILTTVPFAVASWWLIEKRALSLKKLDVGAVGARISGYILPQHPRAKTGESVEPDGSEPVSPVDGGSPEPVPHSERAPAPAIPATHAE